MFFIALFRTKDLFQLLGPLESSITESDCPSFSLFSFPYLGRGATQLDQFTGTDFEEINIPDGDAYLNV